MKNAEALYVGLRTYQNASEAATPFVVRKKDIEQTAKSEAGAFKTAQQLSAKGEIYQQRMWWA